MNSEKFFKDELEAFENKDIKDFCLELLDTAPEYFWQVAASSSGKYHPEYSLGFQGLVRHVKAVTKFLNYILGLDCFKEYFTSRERDLLRTAALNHDDEKLGRNGSQYTLFRHPMLIANRIRDYKGYDWIPDKEIEYIAMACETHMGQWNTDKRCKDTLPLPETLAQQLVHLADYLASRKDLKVLFPDETYQMAKDSMPSPETYVLNFGKYSGTLLADVPQTYLQWLKENITSEPLKSMVDEML